MTSLYLLLLLTQNGAGDVNAAFVNSDSLASCEGSRLMVEAIFKSRSIPVLYQQCLLSDLRFSPFQHADSTRVERHHYLIVPPADGIDLRIEPMGDQQGCLAVRRQVKPATVYCASSVQFLLE
ncbi:MAG: hypothetical protein P8103_09665 [Candidatus Thiodiazotropha sp.]